MNVFRTLPRLKTGNGLGRRTPDDFSHIEKFPVRAIRPLTIESVETTLELPWWHWRHDQGEEGACVGHGGVMVAAITNTAQRKREGLKGRYATVRFDPWWLWDRSKERDQWSDTNPGDDNGTSVSASMDVMRTLGLVLQANRYVGRVIGRKPEPIWGITANRWATRVDEMRSCISAGLPISIGVNWYANFDSPERPFADRKEQWIGRGDLGQVRGGHCVAIHGASDRRQAFLVKNSWGKSYPLVWLPYETMQRLLDEYGEATLITDR